MTVNLSLNEVEAVARKAARGAGYGWGIADEAGRATRWLCANGLNGCDILVSVLMLKSTDQATLVPPEQTQTKWQATDGEICPIMTGTALSDFAFQLSDTNIEISNVAFPAMLLPFVNDAATILNRPVKISWDGFAWTTSERVHRKETGVQFPDCASTVMIEIATGKGDVSTEAECVAEARARVESEVWERLNAFAHLTYAPATEASRLRGAGARLSDND